MLTSVYQIENSSMFYEIVNKSKENNILIFIKFGAKWCGPCKKISPFYENLSLKYKQSIFLSIDVDKVSDVSNNYMVSSLPMFSVIQNGNYTELMKGSDQNKLGQMVEYFVENNYS
jgi:thioredoxin 1